MSIKADDYRGAKSCGCKANEYDGNYWDILRQYNKKIESEEYTEIEKQTNGQ